MRCKALKLKKLKLNSKSLIVLFIFSYCITLLACNELLKDPPSTPDSRVDQQSFNQLQGELSSTTLSIFSAWLLSEGISSLLAGQLVYHSLLPGWQALVKQGENQSRSENSATTKGWIKLTLPCHEELKESTLVLYSTFNSNNTKATLWGDASQCIWDEVQVNASLLFDSIDDERLFMRIDGQLGFQNVLFNNKYLYIADKSSTTPQDINNSGTLSLLWQNNDLRWNIQIQHIEDLSDIDLITVITADSQWECSLLDLYCTNLQTQETLDL